MNATATWSQARTQDGALNANDRQSPSGNNGIAMSLAQCAAQSYACMIQAPALYAQEEEQPFGGAPNLFDPPIIKGPTSAQPVAGFLDQRYGVPQWIFNGSQPLRGKRYAGRFLAQPTFAMNNITGPGQGLSAHYPNALKLINIAFANGRNMFNQTKGYGDKTNFATLELQSFRYTQAQGGGDLAQGVYCIGNGDCVGHSIDTISYGGPNTRGDEGNESARFEAIEGGQVFGAKLASMTTAPDGSVTFTTTSQKYNGFQGEGRFLIDLSRGYNGVANGSYIASISAVNNDEVVDCGGNCNWDSSFGNSTQTTLSTSVGNGDSPTNTFPQSNVTLQVASSAGFAPGKLACIFDYDYECELITAVGAGSVTIATDRLPHLVGAYVTTGGLAGYSIEFEADRVNPSNTNGLATMPDVPLVSTVRNAIPIMYNSSGNRLTLFQGGNTMPGKASGYSGRAYRAMGKGGRVTLTVSGGVVRGCTASGGSGYSTDMPPQIAINGSWASAPSAHISNTISGALSGCAVSASGAGVTSARATVVSANPYDIYPTTKVMGVYDAASGEINGTFYTEPPAGKFAVADDIEEPHYFWQHVRGSNNIIGTYIPSLVNAASVGLSLNYEGLMQGNDAGIAFTNNTVPGVYHGYPASTPWMLGQAQVYAPYGIRLTGSFNRTIYITTPPYGYNSAAGAALTIGCGSLGCANWTTPYFVLGVAGNGGNDGLSYNPSTRAWVLSGSSFSLRTSDGTTEPIVTGAPAGGNSSAWETEKPETIRNRTDLTPHGMTTGTVICQSTTVGTNTCSVPFTLPYSITITGFNLLLATPAAGCATYPDLSLYDQTSGASLISVSPKASAQGPFSASGGPWNTTAGHTYNVRWTIAARACATNLSGAYYSLVW
jgi:hypothetical protein